MAVVVFFARLNFEKWAPKEARAIIKATTTEQEEEEEQQAMVRARQRSRRVRWEMSIEALQPTLCCRL